MKQTEAKSRNLPTPLRTPRAKATWPAASAAFKRDVKRSTIQLLAAQSVDCGVGRLGRELDEGDLPACDVAQRLDRSEWFEEGTKLHFGRLSGKIANKDGAHMLIVEGRLERSVRGPPYHYSTGSANEACDGNWFALLAG